MDCGKLLNKRKVDLMKKKKSGFTLTEMIIVIAVMVVILGCTVSMFIAGNKIFSDSNIKSTFQIQGNDFQEKVSDICMQAEGITEVLDINGNGTSKSENSQEKNIIDEDFSKVAKDEWLDISSLTIKSYYNESDYIEKNNGIYSYKLSTIKFNKNNKTISIITHKITTGSLDKQNEIPNIETENKIADNIKSFKIKNINTNKGAGTLRNTKAIEVEIEFEKKIFKDVIYPIDFSVTFRNKAQ